jgi:hypothetical protein
MKRLLPLVVLALVIIGAVVFLSVKSDQKNDSQNSASSRSETKQFSPPTACDIFTLDDAKKILGDQAQKSDVNPPDASSEDIEVTQCFYEQPAGDTLASIKAQKQASILVRGAKTSKGAESNDAVFKGSFKPAEAQDIPNYGDGAFWNPQFGQFNIYKNGNWYILSVGPSTPSEKTLDDAKKLADALIGKL